MDSRIGLAFFGWAALAAVSIWLLCTSAVPAQSGSTAGGPDKEESALLMLEHSARMHRAKEALVFHRLPEAREHFEELAGAAELLDLPAELRRNQVRLINVARAAARTSSLEQLSDGFAALASTCSGCHAGAPLPFAPPEHRRSQDLRSHMARYVWILDQLWEGLATSNGAAWRAGVQRLSEDHRLCPLHGGQTHALQACPHAKPLHALQPVLASAVSPEDRRIGVGEVVQQCAGCHRQHGVDGPRSLDRVDASPAH